MYKSANWFSVIDIKSHLRQTSYVTVLVGECGTVDENSLNVCELNWIGVVLVTLIVCGVEGVAH